MQMIRLIMTFFSLFVLYVYGTHHTWLKVLFNRMLSCALSIAKDGMPPFFLMNKL